MSRKPKPRQGHHEDYEEGGRMLYQAFTLAKEGKIAEAKKVQKAAWKHLNGHGWTYRTLLEEQPDAEYDVLSLTSRIDMIERSGFDGVSARSARWWITP